jgi:hypothetical protein
MKISFIVKYTSSAHRCQALSGVFMEKQIHRSPRGQTLRRVGRRHRGRAGAPYAGNAAGQPHQRSRDPTGQGHRDDRLCLGHGSAWPAVRPARGQPVQRAGGWQFYTHVDLLLEALALSLFASLLGVSGGVLISLRSATVRQAQQLLIVATLVLVVGGVVVIKVLPAQAISSLSTSQIWLIVMAVLAVLDAILLGVSLVSFRRSRLMLS